MTSTLTAERLDELITEAARQQMRASYAGDLKRRIAPLLVAAVHQALDDGAADEILDSLRPSFDEHAEQISRARAMINPESSIEHVLASGTPELITAWQQLDGHLAVINAIAAIASRFGPRNGHFPLITEYAGADNFRLEDRAIFCTDGPGLEADSAVFKRPDQGHRTSPWFKVALRLHTVDSARDRYRAWAASEWERLHAGPVTSWLDEHGNLHEMPRPTNPYALPEPANR